MSQSYGDRSDPGDKLLSLKKKIKFLERENARLRKELNKALQFVSEARNRLEEEKVDFDESSPKKRKKDGGICDNCGKGSFEIFRLKIRDTEKTYLTCNTCKYRKTQ
jgi:hypothetical protein